MKAITLKKLAYVAPRPRFWRALAHRVLPTVEHRHAFRGLEFDTVLDIGANKGQFAAFAAARWPNAELHCFEPYPPAADKLQTLMGERVNLYRTAIGDFDGTHHLHVASADDSSSLLEMSEKQKNHFRMDEIDKIAIPVSRIDSIFRNGISRNTLIKIDVQGYEAETLRGAPNILSMAAAVYVETSYVELYLGQTHATDIDHIMTQYGFTHYATWNLEKTSGTPLQADQLYLPV